MNLARKSTTKLPQNWPKLRPKDDEMDSGIGSADSTEFHDPTKDDFQEALFNLKALNGASDNLDSKAPGQKDFKKTQKEDGNKNIADSPAKQNGQKLVKDCDILDQIDNIVNDADSKISDRGSGNGKTKDSTERTSIKDSQSEEDDVVMLLGVDDKTETKEQVGTMERDAPKGKKKQASAEGVTVAAFKDRNNCVPKKKHPLQIGAKVRSTVHNIMSKLVQSGNPELSSLINRTRSEDSQDSLISTPDQTESLLLSRPRKGNLFDNLDIDVSDKDSTSPKPLFAKDEESNHAVSQNNLKDNSMREDQSELNLRGQTKPEEKPQDTVSPSVATTLDTVSKHEKSEAKDEKAVVETQSNTSDSVTKKATVESSVCASTTDATSIKSGDFSDQDEKLVIDEGKDDSQEKEIAAGITDRCDKADDAVEMVDKSADVGSSDSVMGAKSGANGDEVKSINMVKSQKVCQTDIIDNNDCLKKHSDAAGPGVLDALVSSASSVTSSGNGTLVKSFSRLGKEAEVDGVDVHAKSPVTDSGTEPMDTTDKSHSCKRDAGARSPAVGAKSDSVNLTDSERKRQHESTAELEDAQVPKKSRLDEVIGKLGERVSVPDGEEEVENESNDYEDSNPGDSESPEKQSEESLETASASEEEDRASVESSKTLRLTSKELDALVRNKVKAFMAQQQVAELRTLRLRVVELQEAQEEWRQKAKDLERQVLDLTVLQQRLEKRKAHTAALRSITTRNFGVQVNEDKLRSNTPQKNVPSKTPPAAPGGVPLPPSTPPAVGVPPVMWCTASQPQLLASGLVATTSNSNVTTITIGGSMGSRNTSVAQLLSQTARMPTAAGSVAPTPAAKPTLTRPPAPGMKPQTQTVSYTNARNSSGILELQTASAGKPMPAATAPSAGSLVLVNAQTGLPVIGKAVTSTAMSGATLIAAPAGLIPSGGGGIKVIDLTMEDEGGVPKQPGKQVMQPAGQVRGMVPQQQLVRQISPMSQGVPTSTILLSSAAGTQIVGAPNLPRAPGMYQVVTIANAQQLRPGSLLTVVPGLGQPGIMRGAAPTSVTTVSRAPAPQILTQMPPGMTLVRPGSIGVSTTVRPAVSGPQIVTSSATRMPVTLTTIAPTGVSQQLSTGGANPTVRTIKSSHPAPPPPPVTRNVPNDTKPVPPRPGLKISRVKQGIVLSWNMTLPTDCIEIASYQLYAYQETSAPPQTSLWKKVGDVKALPLPMACTLTQFQDGNKYHFAVRAVDIHGRTGAFSEPAFIFLSKSASSSS